MEGLGKTLSATDEVVIEATGNCMAVSRVLSPFVRRVVIANPLQVKAIAPAHVKTDKIDAGTLANLYAAGYLPEIWTPDAATERMRRLAARRYQVADVSWLGFQLAQRNDDDVSHSGFPFPPTKRPHARGAGAPLLLLSSCGTAGERGPRGQVGQDSRHLRADFLACSTISILPSIRGL
uniref:IS110 family transposase n=1 Tax=Sinorhizobium medicae TaxID=110321 RepID=UPI003969D387